jgi:hypothetical protein
VWIGGTEAVERLAGRGVGTERRVQYIWWRIQSAAEEACDAPQFFDFHERLRERSLGGSAGAVRHLVR